MGFLEKKVPPSEYQGVWGGISDQGGVEGGQVCNPPRDGGVQKKTNLYFECGYFEKSTPPCRDMGEGNGVEATLVGGHI